MRFALVFSIHASPLSGGLEQARNYRLPFKTFNFPLSGKFFDRVAFMQTSYLEIGDVCAQARSGKPK